MTVCVVRMDPTHVNARVVVEIRGWLLAAHEVVETLARSATRMPKLDYRRRASPGCRAERPATATLLSEAVEGVGGGF
ncbi:MAG: hypothetical protein Fues2KO_39370 [Fuerstiella sp.]